MNETMKERVARVRAEAQHVWNFAQFGKADWAIFRYVSKCCAGLSVTEWVVDCLREPSAQLRQSN